MKSILSTLTLFFASTSIYAGILWNSNTASLNLNNEMKQAIEGHMNEVCPFSMEGDRLYVKNVSLSNDESTTNFQVELSTLPFPDTSVHTTISGYYYERGHERDVFTGITGFETILECNR